MTLDLTWQEFDAAVQRIADEFRGKDIVVVAGIARGGLPLAVAVSHVLNIDYADDLRCLQDIQEQALIVDDIRDSGHTLENFMARMPRANFAVWVTREKQTERYYAAQTDIGDAWVVFPWEPKKRAAQDQRDYQERRQ